MQYTDTEVTAGMLKAADDPENPAHAWARRIAERRHFKVVYTRNPDDLKYCQNPGRALADALAGKFGLENVKVADYVEPGAVVSFPVLDRNGRVVDSQDLSETLGTIPLASLGYVFVEPTLRAEASDWIDKNRVRVLESAGNAEEETDA